MRGSCCSIGMKGCRPRAANPLPLPHHSPPILTDQHLPSTRFTSTVAHWRIFVYRKITLPPFLVEHFRPKRFEKLAFVAENGSIVKYCSPKRPKQA
jgi:hypothetical protein